MNGLVSFCMHLACVLCPPIGFVMGLLMLNTDSLGGNRSRGQSLITTSAVALFVQFILIVIASFFAIAAAFSTCAAS